MADTFDPAEFEAFKTHQSVPMPSGGFDPVEFESFKQKKSNPVSIGEKVLQAVGVPDELAGEAVRTAVTGQPFRPPTVMGGNPSSFLGELTGTISGAAEAGRQALKGGKPGQAFIDEVFRPKNQMADLPGQVAASFMAPEIANAPMNAAVEMGKKVIGPIGKLAAQVSSIGTKVDPKDYETLFNNPEGAIPGKLKQASSNFEKALTDSGIDPKKITSERLKSLKNSEPYAFDKFAQLQEKGSIPPEQALYARQAIDKIYPTPNAKNASYRNMLDGMRKSFSEVLNNATPQIQKASKDYAVAKAGSKFMSAVPLTQAGKPAFFHGIGMEEIIRHALMSGSPEKVLEVLPMVPAAAGLATAGLGMASKPFQALANSPMFKSALLAALAAERTSQGQKR